MQESGTYDPELGGSTEIDPQMIQMMKLADKDFETAIINILHMFKKIQENTSMIWREMANVKKK